ncbi:MAG: RsmB/NOP family class I SAM-dependent RNA methyltransferase [Candidatus Gracilibacteria bacterium]|nr:RsmB/NOP family class I SAM-dependent RNA methyltransferase [Candidatus Gracilibacteria bacterium]
MTEKLPKEFYERLEKIYSKKDIEIIKTGFETEKRKTVFRVNKLKGNTLSILSEIEIAGLKITKIDFLPDAFILENGIERDLWNLNCYKNGEIYIQGISSQIPVLFLDLEKNLKVLDITRAPGSKTSQMRDLMENTGEITANELNAIRLSKLKANIEKLGVTNVKTIKSDAKLLGEKLEKESFDRILADLPCSAEGRINLSNEKTYSFWSEKNIKSNYYLQREILKSCIPLLKKDGILVYSTCTIAPEENEAIVHFILSNFPELQIEEINLDYEFSRIGIKSFGKQVYRKDVEKTLRCLPNKMSEGFYIAKFRKI